MKLRLRILCLTVMLVLLGATSGATVLGQYGDDSRNDDGDAPSSFFYMPASYVGGGGSGGPYFIR